MRYPSLFFNLGLFCACLALYAPSWSNPLVLDDMTKIQWNPDLRNPHPDLYAFISPYAANESAFRNDPSRPVTYFFYWLAWQTGSGATWPFHLLNTVAHGFTCVFLFFIGLRLAHRFFAQSSILSGILPALLFLAAPLLAGSVLYAFALSDLLATAFLLAAWLCVSPWSTGLFYLLALGSKQSAAIFPVLFLLSDFKTWRSFRFLTLAVLTVIYLGGRFLYFGELGDLEAHGDVASRGAYFLSQGVMILKYLSLSLCPWGLTIDHFQNPNDLSLAAQVAGWFAVLALAVLALRATFGAQPFWRCLAWGWLFFFLALLPTSSFLPTVDLFVERRAYLADVGLFLALGMALAYLLRASKSWRPILLSASILLIAVNGTLAVARARIYGSAEALWQESLRVYPRSPRARLNLATTYSSSGRFDQARILLEDLLIDQPANGVIYSKLAFIFQQKNYPRRDDDKAWSYYAKSFALEPNDVVARINAAALLMEHGRLPEAEALLRGADELAPKLAYGQFALGECLFLQNKKSEAAEHFRRTLAADPTFAAARDYLAKIEAESKP